MSQGVGGKCDFCGFVEREPIIVATLDLKAHPAGKVTLCHWCARNAAVICERCHKFTLRDERRWVLGRFYCEACIVIVREEEAERELAEWERIEAVKYAKWIEKCEKEWEERTGKKLWRPGDGLKKLLGEEE